MLGLRRLVLTVETTGPTCGTDLTFRPGLNILRADNSSGKSTCLQSIIYALGLEGMMSPNRDIPLPHAMTDTVDVNGQEFPVMESEVALEVENGQGDILTIRRSVKSQRYDTSLIRAEWGPALSDRSGVYPSRDYFVRRSGAAQREAGFHHEFARFLGWDLPKVTRTDGSEGLLYLECLFPYFFVEQKHGWSGIQARIPTYLGIQEVSKRSAEFILRLDAMESVLESQRLESAIALLEAEWKHVRRRIAESASQSGVLARGIPEKPTSTWRRDPTSQTLQVDRGSGWVSLQDEIDRLSARLDASSRSQVPPVGESFSDISRELVGNQEKATSLGIMLSETIRDLEQAKRRDISLESRISALEDDLQKHKDSAILQRLGSSATQGIDQDHCPTCGQPLTDGFEITDYPLTIEDNIAHLEKELSSFRSMRTDAHRVVEIGQVRVSRVREEMDALRAIIRSQKDALTSPSALPDPSQLVERIQLQERVTALRNVRDSVDLALDEIDHIASSWARQRERLISLRRNNIGAADEAKIEALRGSLISQLQAYGFRSLDPQSIDVSRKTYRPIHEGFDLGFDLSASDMVRAIWAYLFSFLEVSRRFSANHPQLLVFDEPRQQEAARTSFEQLLKRAAQNGAHGSQIIFATSEEEGSLSSMLHGLPHSINSIPRGEKLIRPRAS